jgi:hypothetical protein
VAGSNKGWAHVFDLATGTVVTSLRGAPQRPGAEFVAAFDVSFAPGSDTEVVMAREDGTVETGVCLLCRSPRGLLGYAERRLTGFLTTAECERYLHTSVCPS